MKIRDVFPAVYAGRYSQEVETFWEQDYHPADQHLVFVLEDIFTVECALAQELTLDEFRKHINLIFDDIIIAKKHPAMVLPFAGLDLLLLIHGAKAAGTYNQRGAMLDVFDCLTKSLYGRTMKNGEQYESQPERLWRFANPQSWQFALGVDVLQIITLWLGQLFYYSRSFSGLSQLCQDFLELSIKWAAEVIRATTMDGAFLLTQLYAWTTEYQQPDKAKDILDIISTVYSELSWGPLSAEKQHLGVHLVLTSKQPAQRESIYAELKAHGTLSAQDKMQIACEIDNSIDAIKTNFDAILTAVREFSHEVEARAKTLIDITYEKSRLFKVLNNVILTLCQHAATTELATLLTAYYHPDADWAPRDSILFILPNAKDGVLYCAKGGLAVYEQDNVVAVPVLVDMANQALSQLHVLRGTPGQITPVPERTIGFPILPLGREFERTVSSFYNLRKLGQLDISGVTALCPFNFNQLPLQALMLKELQVTFPIYTSLQNKGAYPRPRHVLFWQGSSVTSEMEGNALAYIFEKAGIKLTVLVEGTATKQDFIDAYRSPDYDIIWVSSHGERGYYEPDNSSFALSHTEAVSLTELAAITVQHPHVRLLFLNVCEGGANTQIGEFLNVGFGHVVTSDNQDVLSHLWMADSLVAMLLGALVAEGLCQSGATYFSAYQSALLTLIAGEAGIINKLTSIEPETQHPAITALIDRLQYSSNADLSNILKWGSAVYFS